MAEVRLQGVHKIFENGSHIIHDVTIDIHDKEFVILVGPSGCGKSTILRMIAGLEDISKGDIYIDNKRVNNVPPKDRNIAMVFQNYALYPHMDVYGNMAFGLKMRGVPKEEVNSRVCEAAKILDIDDLLNRKPKELSGGQRQRVALGRAIVRKPKVFLFDEPLSNLDAKLRVTMRAEISKLHKRLQTTIIYVTHDQTEAMTMGTKIVTLHKGYIQQIDSPMNTYKNPANKFVASFIGSPPMNFLKVSVGENNSRAIIKNDSFSLNVTDSQNEALCSFVGKNVFLGVRPEDLYIEGDMQNTITGTIEVIEPLGSEMILRVSSPKHDDLIVKTSPKYEFQPGETVELGVNVKRCKFFTLEDSISNLGNKENRRII